MYLLILSLCVLLLAIPSCFGVCTKDYCLPGEQCWPSAVDIALFKGEISGYVLQPFDPGYINEIRMTNTRFVRSPALIVLAVTVGDVQEAVLFANRFNIRLTVLSSGHDRNGKSTADGSLQVNLSRMRSRIIRLEDERHPDGTITVESGNTWGNVYEEVDRVGRVISGGSSSTVAMGGFTTGGGHGPLSRSLGLAVDNLLAVEMVTANGSLVSASLGGGEVEPTNPDLFWAIRGGGGGTFGIITTFTFKLHIPPASLVSLFCRYPFVGDPGTEIGQRVLSTYLNRLPSLPAEWSGYLVTSRYDTGLKPNIETAMFTVLLHYGPWDAKTRPSVQPLVDELTQFQFNCQYTNVSSFWEWKRNFTDDVYFRNYVTNVFLHYDSFRPELYDVIVDSSNGSLSPDTDARLSCTFSLLGGKVTKVPSESTAISPAFRTALVSLTCGTGWQNPALDDIHAQSMIEFGKKLRRFGRGVYYSEPDQNLPNWKSEFWGRHYPRLLQVKTLWDANNTFFCPQCVGSDTVNPGVCSVQPQGPDSNHRENATLEETPRRDFTGQKFCSKYCSPGHNCWPSAVDILQLEKSLDGFILTPMMEGYSPAAIMKNTLYTAHPGIIVMAKSNGDVQKSIRFVKKHNLRLTVLSSGHDYNGRSTADGGLQINLSGMKKRQVHLEDKRSDTGSTIYAQTGNVWGEMYREVDKHGKIVVGGSAQTVALGGYTTGGGHSQFSRSYGLAVDNVVEFEIVLADGTLANISGNGTVFVTEDGSIGSSPSTDLFWAVLGGGGGTFGVVTSFTYKLHESPSQLVSFYCVYPVNVGQNIIARNVTNFFFSLIPNLSPKWGGYFIMTQVDPAKNQGVIGSVSFALLHNGLWKEPSVKDVEPLIEFMKEHQIFCGYTANHTSFLDYKKNNTDPIYYRNYIFNTLSQNDTTNPDLTETMLEGFVAKTEGAFGCTGVILGGKVTEFASRDTAVHPGLRTAVSSLTCGIAWEDPASDSVNIEAGRKLGEKLHAHGIGVYVNEPEMILPTWKEDFWGPHYDRLLSIKQRWDRDNLFYCHHCVGSDLVENFSCNKTNSTDQSEVEETTGCDAYMNPLFHDGPMTGPLNEGVAFCSRYCLLGNPCFPTDEEFAKLTSSLSGSFTYQSAPEFFSSSTLEPVYESPIAVVFPSTIADIQQALLFARRHNLRVAPISSGLVPSTGESLYSSLQINLSNMTQVTVNLNDARSPTGASVRAGVGSTWAQVYEEVDKYGKVVAGSGYPGAPLDKITTAGGFGPLSRTLGLASDNLLSFSTVLPDGQVAEISEDRVIYLYPNGTVLESSDPELFWAVRGGGANTFGIISSLSFAIHDAPTGFVHYTGIWRLNSGPDTSTGREMLEKFHRILPTLSSNWGGEIVTVARPPENGINGSIEVSLLHYGWADESAIKDVQRIDAIEPEGRLLSHMDNYTTYWDFQKKVGAEYFNYEYVFNTFIQYESDPRKTADFMVNVTLDFGKCRETLVGGKISEARADSAAINPDFRRAVSSLTCSFVWNDTLVSEQVMKAAEDYSKAIRSLGDGMYLNDVDTKLSDWQTDVWGFHYDRLLEMKEEYDPRFLLTCESCIGSEKVLEFFNETNEAVKLITTPGYLSNYTKPSISAIDFENNEFISRFCVHGLPCWPSNAQFVSLNKSLDGNILRPRDPGFGQHTNLVNNLRRRSPGVIVFPLSVADVQRAILFARKHNLKVSVLSSGHGFSGKNTAAGGLQINLSRMTGVALDPVDTGNPMRETVTVQAGATWRQIYQEVNKWKRRVVVGPSSLGVSPSGYTMGGGFSPVSPSLGLAVDNVVSFQMVTADGRVVESTKTGNKIIDTQGNVTSDTNGDLFWALRGGGGGTFGIVTQLTYQLHFGPSQLVGFNCVFAPTDNPKQAMREIVNFFHGMLNVMPREWAGKFILSNPAGHKGDLKFAALHLLHYGPLDAASSSAVEPFFDFKKEWQTTCSYSPYNTFWDYIKSTIDLPYERSYVANGLLSPDRINPKLTDVIVDQVFSTAGQGNAKTCFYDILGGKVGDPVNHTDALNPSLREARLSVVCSVTWTNDADDVTNVAAGRMMSEAVYNVTNGVYLNYAAYDLPNWKTDFWKGKYNELLEVKKRWDSENFFHCRHCVGSELVANFRTQRRRTETQSQATVSTATKAVGSASGVVSYSVYLIISLSVVVYKLKHM